MVPTADVGKRMLTNPKYITIGKRFRKELGDIDVLVSSIRDLGLIHPIVVDDDNRLIAGERRLAACLRLGLKLIPVTVVDVDADHLKIEMDENTVRANFTPSEAVAIAKAVKDRVKTPVGKHVDQRDSAICAISGRTVDKAAKVVGMSGRTLEKATAVVDAAAADPSLEPVVEEMDRTGKVDPAYRLVKGKGGDPGYRVLTPRSLASRWADMFVSEAHGFEDMSSRLEEFSSEQAHVVLPAAEEMQRALRTFIGRLQKVCRS